MPGAYIKAITAKVGDNWEDVPVTTSANVVFLNGRTGTYQLFQYALCACDDSVSGAIWNMVPLATSGGTGNKTANYNAKFPIGCSIYYHPETVAYAANTDFSGKPFYTTYDDVDARYTAINPTGLNLHNSSASEVFLHVNVDDGYWSPYYKTGAVNEIIVTSNSLASGNFYIYLGKTSESTTYKFQLESNHPLYYYDGTQLIDYATWIASQNAVTIQDPRIVNGTCYSMSGYSNGTSFNMEFVIPSDFYTTPQSRYTMAFFDMHATLRNNSTATTVEYWLEVGYYENGTYVTEEVLGSGQVYMQRGASSAPIITSISMTGGPKELTSRTTHVRAHFESATAIDLLSSTTLNSKQRASLIRVLVFVPV